MKTFNKEIRLKQLDKTITVNSINIRLTHDCIMTDKVYLLQKDFMEAFMYMTANKIMVCVPDKYQHFDCVSVDEENMHDAYENYVDIFTYSESKQIVRAIEILKSINN